MPGNGAQPAEIVGCRPTRRSALDLDEHDPEQIASLEHAFFGVMISSDRHEVDDASGFPTARSREAHKLPAFSALRVERDPPPRHRNGPFGRPEYVLENQPESFGPSCSVLCRDHRL